RSSAVDVASLAPPRPALDRGRVEIWDVSVRFRSGGKTIHALENTSVDISPGSFVCLLGPSGCGKSTLLNTVAGYVRPTTGWARVDGDQVVRPGPDRGMVFQQYSLFPWKTVRDNVAFGPYAQGKGRVRARHRRRTARYGRPDAFRPSLSDRAFGWHAAEGRHCAGARQQAYRLADGRAFRRPRRANARGDAGEPPAALGRIQDHGPIRHP